MQYRCFSSCHLPTHTLYFELLVLVGVPLERLCLLIRFLGLGRPKPFLQQVLDPPAEGGVTAALQHLRALGAMDDKNCLTPLGSHLAGMPVDAQVGKLLIYGSLLRCPEQILTIAAGLSVRSPFTRDVEADQTKRRLSGKHMSDHVALLLAVQGWQERRQCTGVLPRDGAACGGAEAVVGHTHTGDDNDMERY